MKKILFLPIDNRPVTYTLAAQLADIYKNLELILPERKLLGGLLYPCDQSRLLKWLKSENSAAFIILSLDTIAYGGLVSSRRCSETPAEIKARLEVLKNILKNTGAKVYAVSSIMRISNNNTNEEEKEYWADWGKNLFEYAYNLHKTGVEMPNDIPKEILDDYLSMRKRNFEINHLYLDWLEEGILDYLVFSKDDTGKFGLNVLEAEALSNEIQKRNLNAIVKTGADEIPMGLMLRAVTDDLPIKIKPVFAHPETVDKISRYEDISVQSCTEAQIFLGVKNAVIVQDKPDIILYVNNFIQEQGDLVFRDVINSFKGKIPEFTCPYAIADINNANGADSALAEEILETALSRNFLGYSGYNTSANSIGSALAIGIVSLLAQKSGKFNEVAFKKLLVVRLLDDWAYQANIRKNVESGGKLCGFELFEEKIKRFTGSNFEVKYSLPWKRSFEIEIAINGNKI